MNKVTVERNVDGVTTMRLVTPQEARAMRVDGWKRPRKRKFVACVPQKAIVWNPDTDALHLIVGRKETNSCGERWDTSNKAELCRQLQRDAQHDPKHPCYIEYHP